MEVISSKSSSTLWAFSESGVIATSDTFRAEDMEAFGEDSILLSSAATWAVQLDLANQRGSRVRITDSG